MPLLLAGWALAFQFVQFLLQLFPILLVLFGVDGIIQVCVKFQHILPQSSRHWVGAFMREVMHEASIRFVCQDVLARTGFASRVKVAVREPQRIVRYLLQEAGIIFDGVIHALDVHVFGLGRWNLEAHSSEGTDFGNDLQEERQNARSDTRLAVNRSPLAFVAGAIQVIEKFLFAEIGISFTN